MATKWKDKRIGKVIIWLAIVLVGISILFSNISSVDRYFTQNYYKTPDFEQSYVQPFFDNLTVLRFHTAEKLKKDITVTEDDIYSYRNYYGTLEEQRDKIRMQYDEKIENARITEDKKLEELYKKERDEKLQHVMENFESDAVVREKIITEKKALVDRFYANEEGRDKNLKQMSRTFLYYFVDDQTGEVYTNTTGMTEGVLTNEKLLTKEAVQQRYGKTNIQYQQTYDSAQVSYDSFFNHEGNVATIYGIEDVTRTLPTHTVTGQIFMLKDSPKSSEITASATRHQTDRMFYIAQWVVAFIAIGVGVILYRKWNIRELIHCIQPPSFYNRVRFDVKTLLAIMTVFLAYSMFHSTPFFMNEVAYSIQNGYFGSYMMSEIVYTIWWIAVFFAAILQMIWLVPIYTDPVRLNFEYKKTFVAKLVTLARDVFHRSSLGMKALFAIAVFFLGGIGIFSILVPPLFLLVYIPLFVFILLPTLYHVIRHVNDLNDITEGVERGATGRWIGDMKVRKRSLFAPLIQNLNKIQSTAHVSQQREAKSERLKTELISNVSHDLRTPLTSVITYADLLKNPNITEEERQAYIEIIDRKSKRLKVLIDDLFEVSKMASGNIELNRERVDVAQLLRQSLGELDDKIQESSLQFRLNIETEPIFGVVDGQKLWRVFDNLITNTLKYSLEQSRVYITLKQEHDRAVIQFKNISKYELGTNVDELLERFKRGDTSRNTEGSGLGLAIAKSIVDLHNGQFDIQTDGDLFTVTVVIPLRIQ